MSLREKDQIQHEIISQDEKEKILRDIFYHTSKTGYDSFFLYKGRGGELYEKILQSRNYPAYQDEKDILVKHREELMKYIKHHVSDIWAWTWEKFILLMEWDSSNNHDIVYHPADMSKQMLDIAANNVKEKFHNNIKIESVVMETGTANVLNSLSDNTHLWLGCTIGNFDSYTIEKMITNMDNNWIIKGNNIILTYFDVPQDEAEIKKTIAMYDNKESQDFVFNGLEVLWLDPSKFLYKVAYDKGDNSVLVEVEAKEDLVIQTEHYPKEIEVKKWQMYVIHRSKRFTEEEIKQIIKNSWGKIKEHISENGISLLVVAKKARLWQENKKYIIPPLIAVLTTVGGVKGYDVYQNKQIEKKIQQHDLEQIRKQESTYKDGFYNNEKERLYDNLSETDKLKVIEWMADKMYETFVIIYGDPDIKTTKMKEYLKHFLISYQWWEAIRKFLVQDDYETKKMYLSQFMNMYASEMFKEGIENIEVYGRLDEYKDAFINTLQYKGPLKEGYDPVTKKYYMIKAVREVWRYQLADAAENVMLMDWYIVENTWTIDTITVDKYMYDRTHTPNSSVIELERSEPDEEGRITIKRFVMDLHTENGYDELNKYWHEVIFLKTDADNDIGHYNNVKVDADVVMDYFQQSYPQVSLAFAWLQLGDDVSSEKNIKKIKEALVLDMIKNNMLEDKNLYDEAKIQKYLANIFVPKYKESLWIKIT